MGLAPQCSEPAADPPRSALIPQDAPPQLDGREASGEGRQRQPQPIDLNRAPARRGGGVPRAALAVLILLAGCQPGTETAQGTAQRFVDAHYVRIDLPAAKEFCVGLAAHKIEQEMDLVKGQVIDESTRMPRIHYKLLEEKSAGEEEASFVFEGSIRVEDADTFTRKWLVTTRREAGVWKVSNYQEYE